MRLKAQFELVRRADVTTFRVTASRAEHQLARIHSLWSIGQLARRDPQHSALLEALTSDPDPEIRAPAARMIGDGRDGRLAGALLPLVADAAPRARFFAAEALGRLAYGPAIPALVQMPRATCNVLGATCSARARCDVPVPRAQHVLSAKCPCHVHASRAKTFSRARLSHVARAHSTSHVQSTWHPARCTSHVTRILNDFRGTNSE